MKLGRNRWHVAAWVVALCLTATTVAVALLGDVNSDGLIDGTDAQQVLESVVGTRTFTPAQQADADVDGDGDVDVADAQFIRQFASGAITAFPTRLPANSSPISVTRKGDLVGVVHPDGDLVVFVQTATDTVAGQVAVGSEPTGIAFSRDGKRAYVTIAREARVSVIDTTTFAVVGSIPVGVEPFGVVVNFRGDRAYVSNMASSTVSVIDLGSETVTGTVAVSGKPQGLAVTSGSDKVLVTHLNGAQVSVIDAATLAVTTIALPELAFDEFNPTQPAGKPNRMKGIAIHPTLSRAWLPHQLSNSGNFVETLFNTTIFPAVSVVNTATNAHVPGERMTLFSGLSTVVSAAEAVAFAPSGLKAYVVSAASNDLTIVNVSTRQQVGLIRDVGDNPRGIVVTPNGTKAYVFNRLTPQVSVVSLASETLLYTVPVGSDPLSASVANGRRLFFSSAPPEVAQDRFFSCEACHFDGRDDGQTWFFTNGPRQSLSMAGGTLQTGLLHHNADRIDVPDFAFTFTRLQNGTGVTPDQLDDLAEFVNTGIRFLENPFLNPDGSLTAAARRGRRIFRDPAVACATCHSGAFLTDATGHTDPASPVLHDVGVFAPGVHSQDILDKTRDQEGIAAGTARPAGSFESTSLLGVFASAPYLHDGRSATLLETLTTGNPTNEHGVTSGLSAPQRSDLVAYLQQLDITQARVQIAVPADDSRVVSLTKVTGPVLSDVVSVQVFVDGAGPIAATISSGTFTANVPPGMVPSLSPGQRFEIRALATTSAGEPGRDDIEVEANFGGTASLTTSTVDAAPALIPADGVSTATVIITPRDGSGVVVGTGLDVQAQATAGTLGPVVDLGSGKYAATLTSSVAVGTSTISARIGAGSFFTDTAEVRFAAGSVDAVASAAVVVPTTLEANGVSTSVVTITPRDAFSNNLGSGESVGVSTNQGTLSAVTDRGDGTYTATYKAATTTGTGTITVTVNGVTLGTTPTVTLVPDVTAPSVADLAKIGFAAPSGGSSLVTGGAGSVEGLATVRADNTSRVSVFATAVAAADGSFALTLPLTSNETVCFKVTDLASNMSGTVCKVPFPVAVTAVHGFVRTPHNGGGFDPVSGAAVQLDLANVSDPLAPTFTQLFIGGAYLTSTTAVDGSYTIVVPSGFTSDPNHAVVTGPDANHDGRVDSITEFALVNDISRSVTVDSISSSIIFLIGYNDVLLDIATPYPQTNFTPAERIDIESSVRAATTEVDFFGADGVQAIADDVFFDVDGPKTQTDQVAYVTFDTAAQSGGPTEPPVFIQGRVTIPKTGGVHPLAGVTVRHSTLSINPLVVSPIPGYTGVTDANGYYTLQLPSSVTPGSTAVNIVVGDLTYNASGIPGAFNSSINKFSIGAFVTSETGTADVDIAGRVAMSLIQIPSVPIGNFTPLEMDDLIALVRAKLLAAPVVLTNKTLEQVFVASFNAMVADSQVIALLNQIKDAEAGLGNSLVTASPTTLQANGIAVSTITVEPRDASSQRVGPGLLVELSATLGSVTTPAIDNQDGTYTAFLKASTITGTATVTAHVEGAELTQKPAVTMTTDNTAPAAPLASRLVFTGVGANAATIVGLQGAAEASSTLTVENTTRGVTGTFAVSSDGGFRADINASAGDSLLLRATDIAGNTSTNTSLTVPVGLTLPAIGNPSAVPGGLSASVAPLAQASLGVSVPSGFTFLGGFTLTLTGSGIPTAPLDVVIDSGVPVPAGAQLILAQTIRVSGATQLRVVAPAQASGGVLSPVSGANVPGVLTAGSYAYLAASTAQSFVHGTVSGSRGAVKDVAMTVSSSPFVDLTRADGTYFSAGPVGPSRTIGAQLFAHVAAQQGTTRLPYGGAKVRFDFTLGTRANVSFAFTGRFTALGQNTRRMALTPSGERLYAALNDVGDISILDTSTMTQASLADDSQNVSDLAFSPNGFEAFIGYLNRVRDFTVAIEEPGLLLTGLGFPQDVAITPNSDVALIASSIDNVSTDANPDRVHFIDTFGNVVQTPSVNVNADPRAIAINRAGTRAYVVSRYQSALTVIDIAAHTVHAQFSVGTSPTDVAVAPDDSQVYVSDAVGNTVTVLSAAGLDDATPSNEVIGVVGVGAAPGALALTPDGATLLVAEQQDDTVSLIDTVTRTVTSVWATVDLPADLVVHPTGKTVYVLDPVTQKGVLEAALASSDTTAPAVLDAGPQDRSGQLLQDSPIEVVFTEKMNEATFTLANVQVTDAGDNPLAGTLASAGDGVTVVFTPSPATRYALNSTVKVTPTTGVTDASGVALAASVLKTVPTVTMQLPDLAKISITLTASGVEVNGAAAAVHPHSLVEVTNVTAAGTFTATAAADGSFHLVVTGLDTDTYELVSSIFGGRARTNPIALPVSFTISFPNPALISYQPGPAGTLLAVGAAGAVDSKCTLVRIRNTTSGQSFDTTSVPPDGSFSVGIFASSGHSLEIVTTLLGSVTLNPVALPAPSLPPPVLDFVTPSQFTFGDAVTLTAVGAGLGNVAGNIRLEVGGQARGDFVLDDVAGQPGKKAIVVDLASGADSGSLRVTVAGQASNSLSYFAKLAANTSPFAEQVIASTGVTNRNLALGQSDGSFAVLAHGGTITLRMGSTIMDGPGNDFQVFEDTSDGGDCYTVLVSAASAGPFDSLGQACGTAFVNLNGHGPIRFVRIVDANDGGNAAKIDAVFAIRVRMSVSILLLDGQGTPKAVLSGPTPPELEGRVPNLSAPSRAEVVAADPPLLADGGTGVDLNDAGITVQLAAALTGGQVEIEVVEGNGCYEVRASSSIVGEFRSYGRRCGTAEITVSGPAPVRYLRLLGEGRGSAVRIGTVTAVGIEAPSKIVQSGKPPDLPTSLAPQDGITVTITPGDVDTCAEAEVGLGVSVSPPPQGGGGYGGGCSDDIDWTLSGDGSLDENDSSATFTAPDAQGRSTVQVTVNRTGNCQTTGSDSKSANIDYNKPDISGHEPGKKASPGAAVPEADEEDPTKLVARVNEDQDDAGADPDNDDTSIGADDDDIVNVTMKKLQSQKGTVTLSVNPSGDTRVFNNAGAAALANDSVDLAAPAGDMAALASGDLDLYLEALNPKSDVVVKMEYTSPDGASCSDEVHLSALRIDLDVDTDRDGTVDKNADEEDEDDWVTDKGAIYNVNLDADGGLTSGGVPRPDAIHFDDSGTPVNENFVIEIAADQLDITPLVIQKVADDIDASLKVFIKVAELEDIRRIHVFKKIAADPANTAIWGSMTGGAPATELDITKYVDPADPDFAGDGSGKVTLGIEGLAFRYQGTGTPAALEFDGEVDLEIELRRGSTVIASDEVRLKVAPWIMLTRAEASQQIWAEDAGGDNDEFRLNASADAGYKGLDDSGQLRTASGADAGTRWFQDHIQFGYTQRPGGPKTHMVFRVPYARSGLPPNPVWSLRQLLAANVGAFTLGNWLGGGSGDYGGNIEALVPNATHQLGRITLGNTVSVPLKAFLESQEVQKPIFDVPTDWLIVGHIDEITSALPGGVIVISDPTQAWNLISDPAKIPVADRHKAIFFATGGAPAGGVVGAAIRDRLYDGPATGWIVTVGEGSLVDGEAFTISQSAGTSRTFEIEIAGNGVTAGNVAIDLSAAGAASANAIRDAVVTAVNGAGFTVKAITDGTATVHLWNETKGVAGNVAITETIANAGFAVLGMTGGKAGTDFTTRSWQYMRTFTYTAGKPDLGQVAHISARHDGWVEIDQVWATTSLITGGVGLAPDIFHWSERPLFPTTEWGNMPVNGDKYAVVEGTRRWQGQTLVVERQCPAIVSVEEVLADTDFEALNKTDVQGVVLGAGAGSAKSRLQAAAPGGALTFVSVPNLFFGERTLFTGGETAVAFNPGPTNLQPIAGKLYVPRQFGPLDTTGKDIYQESIKSALGGTVEFVDDWDFYHRQLGEVHCGSEVKLALPAFDWWTLQP